MFKLICCDGGGIRGLVTALLIQDLDSRFGVIARADGFAGTSTGGLIALGLVNGTPISDIVDIYKNDGESIFDPNGWFADEEPDRVVTGAEIPQGLLAGPGVFSCQYKHDGVLAIAKKMLGNKRLSDVDRYVSVNTVRLWDGYSWMATTLSNASGNTYADVKMHDAALATSAAPTYFPPYEIEDFGFFADGGTFANNPSVSAVADALSGGRFNSLDQALVLSLGTGVVNQGIPPDAVNTPLDWGVTHWLWPQASGKVPTMALLDMMMACTSQVATAEARQLLAERFCRGNAPLGEPYALDDWEHVDDLINATEAYMKTPEWTQVRTWVEQRWV